MTLEEQLRRALARQDPPKGFAGRVAARLNAAAASMRPAGMPTARRRLIGLAMAATLAIGTGSTLYVAHQFQVGQAAEADHLRAEQMRAERLRNDAVTGLRIASAKLNEVHERLLAHLEQVSSRNEQNERAR